MIDYIILIILFIDNLLNKTLKQISLLYKFSLCYGLFIIKSVIVSYLVRDIYFGI